MTIDLNMEMEVKMKKVLDRKRILVFAPSFFGYEKKIVDKLSELGADVNFFDERPSNSTFGKTIVRLKKKLASYMIDNYYKKIKQELNGKKYDSILFFQAEATPRWFLTYIFETYQYSRKILYLWDPVTDMPDNISNTSNVDLFDEVFTFDPHDAQKYSLRFRPLFYDDSYLKEVERHKSIQYDFSFIGTVRRDRYDIMQRLKKNAQEVGQKYFVFYYLQSKLMFYYFKYLKKDFVNAKIADFSFKSLTHEQIQDVIEQSKIIVDIQKPHQVGLTIRTIELLAARQKFVTTNTEIFKYDFYNKNNIDLLNREEPLIRKDFVNSATVSVSEDIMTRYSIGYFLLELLGYESYNEYYDFGD